MKQERKSASAKAASSKVATLVPSTKRMEISEILEDETLRPVFQKAIDTIDQGVIMWSADGVCEFVNRRANELTEVREHMLEPGRKRSDMMAFSIQRGTITQEQSDRRDAMFEAREHFSFTRRAPSGRIIFANVRARSDGGHAVTLTDITDFAQAEEELAEARAHAKKVSAELDRLNKEKVEFEAREGELRQMSLVAAHAKDLILISDATYRIIWANEAFCRHNEFNLEMDLLGKSGRDALAGPETDTDTLAKIDEAVRNRQNAIVEMVCHKRSGKSYWMEQELIPVFNNYGEHTNFIMVGRDISERKEAEAAAREAREFEEAKRAESKLLSEFTEWLQSSDTLGEVFVVVSSFLGKLIPSSNGAIYTYGATRDLLEVACEWGDGEMSRYLEPGECWALRRGRSYFFGDNTVDIPCLHAARTKEEDKLHQYCLPIVAHGDTVGLLSVVIRENAGPDMQKLVNFCSEHISLAIANVNLREQLREQSTSDPLTGLYNRRFFLDFATRELSKCTRQDRPASLITIDVDHFKNFNDTHGHDAGDMVLKALADLLKRMFRDSDVPCRMGGEEFVVILPGAGVDRGLERGEELRRSVEQLELRYSGETLQVTISVGVSALGKHGDELGDLMEAADRALYKAKDDGRNCVRLA